MGASIKDTAESVRARKAARKARNADIPLSAGMILVTLGVVYGDIGTSPMYTLKSIVANNGGISTVSESLIIGALSLVIWTMTLVTTVKYVVIAMKADNHHEGGIFALYSLVKRCAKWLIIPAMVGGAALLADGILTPAVTVTTAIEGLRTIPLGHEILGDGPGLVMAITIAIVCVLFAVQRAGTSSIGKFFGPVMTLWFLFLGGAGLLNLFGNPVVLKALNPIYGIQFLVSPVNNSGLQVMGYVFLATTGAEALYSDMGHVGKSNIYASWPVVKICLILNYLGQGAWLLGCDPADPTLTGVVNPFYQMLPEMMRPFAIILSAVAAIIASQALITGSYTLVSEAVRLDLMPHMRINYPSETKGQIYIPMVNSIMWIGTIFVVLLFQTSERMEAAYGLAITITMLMTTTLLTSYIAGVRKNPAGAGLFAVIFGAIEAMFFASCLTMFFDGGYVMVILAAVLFVVMYTWRRGTAIERTQTVFLPVDKYLDQLFDLCHDDEVPYLADNLVFLTNDSSIDKLDRDILYSILDKQPKRAKAYYFLNVQVTDEPFTHEYIVNDFDTDFLFKVQLRLGFKVNQRVNTYLYQIVQELVDNHQISPQNHKYSIYRTHSAVGDFRFCLIRKVISPETDLSGLDYRVMELKYLIRRMCGSPAKWYGLENSSILFEYVPLFSKRKTQHKLTRVQLLDAEPSSPKRLEKSAKAAPDAVDDDEDIFSMTMRGDRENNIVSTLKDLVGGDTATFKPLVINEEEDDEDENIFGEDEIADGE
ncbi:KUP/HAK/KT family potassium transporter [Paratractidigestivibacter sp.]|uniref:KUP/HAK/KT family potassium transporter n=1 Tax=Paratractidigestivibacter sp. TaxID=2847316 RepID=UPI002ABE3B20|nr:KUP/HAK/KT family potassium transporter [Paratractidigestivibacter sp.]